MRQHTLLWELANIQGAPIDCEAWAENGAVHVLVKPTGQPELTETFPECADAVRWAIDLERTLVAEGWKKVI